MNKDLEKYTQTISILDKYDFDSGDWEDLKQRLIHGFLLYKDKNIELINKIYKKIENFEIKLNNQKKLHPRKNKKYRELLIIGAWYHFYLKEKNLLNTDGFGVLSSKLVRYFQSDLTPNFENIDYLQNSDYYISILDDYLVNIKNKIPKRILKIKLSGVIANKKSKLLIEKNKDFKLTNDLINSFNRLATRMDCYIFPTPKVYTVIDFERDGVTYKSEKTYLDLSNKICQLFNQDLEPFIEKNIKEYLKNPDSTTGKLVLKMITKFLFPEERITFFSSEINKNKNKVIELYKKSVYFYRASQIYILCLRNHIFSGGNTRTANYISNLYLVKHGYTKHRYLTSSYQSYILADKAASMGLTILDFFPITRFLRIMKCDYSMDFKKINLPDKYTPELENLSLKEKLKIEDPNLKQLKHLKKELNELINLNTLDLEKKLRISNILKEFCMNNYFGYIFDYIITSQDLIRNLRTSKSNYDLLESKLFEIISFCPFYYAYAYLLLAELYQNIPQLRDSFLEDWLSINQKQIFIKTQEENFTKNFKDYKDYLDYIILSVFQILPDCPEDLKIHICETTVKLNPIFLDVYPHIIIFYLNKKHFTKARHFLRILSVYSKTYALNLPKDQINIYSDLFNRTKSFLNMVNTELVQVDRQIAEYSKYLDKNSTLYPPDKEFLDIVFKCISLDKFNPILYKNLAAYFFKYNDWENAIKYTKEYLKLLPLDYERWLGLAELYKKKDEFLYYNWCIENYFRTINQRIPVSTLFLYDSDFDISSDCLML